MPWIVLGGAVALVLGTLDTTQHGVSAALAEAPLGGVATLAEDALVTPPQAALDITSSRRDATPAASTADDGGTDYVDRVTPQGQSARGLYFSSDVVAALGAEGVIRVVRNARMNAAVIDLKDERGRITYATQIPELQRSRRGSLGDAPAIFRELKAAGVYVIGRIVCFSDPLLPKRFPDLAVLDGRPYKQGQIWGNWARNHPWLDPYNPKTHALLVSVAKEVEALGVDEIQLDYIRFPVDEATKFAVFPAQTDKSRQDVLLGLLEQMDRAVHIPLGVDVFGLTTMPWGKPQPLGQVPEAWQKHVEVFSPMLYLNGMRAWHDQDRELRAERLIAVGVATLRKRVGHMPVIRPFLQGFPQGADHYDTDFISEQVRGARRAGADGFLFWHPASRYALIQQTGDEPGAKLMAFQIQERTASRQRMWDGAQAR